MKILGITICIVGTVLGILFVPVQMLGMGMGWHFILGQIDLGFGMMVPVHEVINTTALILQLMLVNGIGFGLFLFGTWRARQTK